MGSDNSSDTGGTSSAFSFSKLASISTAVVLTVIWCFVFLLVFIICLLLWKTKQNEVTNADVSLNEVTNADVSLNEVSEKTRIRENHKSYKERVNSVYFEWLVDHSPQRKPINSELNEMIEMS
ncbi:hypothetical protein PO909_015619 [Leuciscus waleckii]